MSGERADLEAIAGEVFGLLDSGRQVTSFSKRFPGFAIDDAYRVTGIVRTLRESRGETVVGRKIGFTNRAVWGPYGYPPMWNYVYDRTIHDLAETSGILPLAGLAEPRIEPEIVFRLGLTPAPGMDEMQLLSCIAWIAPGFEIVQSLFPGWAFSAPDAISAFGLHGALLVGPHQSVSSHAEDWKRMLSGFEVDLMRDGGLVDLGHSANVMGGPLFALGHLVDLIAKDGLDPPLAAGEIISTGTLTTVPPVAAGETWTASFSDIALAPVTIRFV